MTSVGTGIATIRGLQNDKASLRRVLYVVDLDPSHKFGSAEEQIALISRTFQEKEGLFLPLFICAPPQKPTPLEGAGVTIVCLDLHAFRWRTLVSLLALIRKHDIELVHWNFTDPIWESYSWWLTFLRPTLRQYYTDRISRDYPLRAPPAWKRTCKRWLLRRYAKIVSVSQFIADRLAIEATSENIVCLRHFVNVERFKPDEKTRSMIRAAHARAGRFVVLTVGHLIESKGIDVLLRALACLPDEIILWIVGFGPQASALEQLAQELGIAHRVTFHGRQTNVEAFMQGADCYVCPSRWAEAAGLVNLEAQACGLPVIASNVGGIPEYVADGRTGYLVAAEDAAAIADRIWRLASDAALCARLGRNARAHASECFSLAARLNDVLAIYEK